MPTVPFSSVPHVSPQPLQPPRLNPSAPIEAFGGGIASEAGGLGDLSGAQQAAQRIADETQRIRLEATARANQIKVTDMGGQAAFYATHKLHDPDTGLLNQLGENAAGSQGPAREEFWNVMHVIGATAGNDDQRAAFDRIAQTEFEQFDRQLTMHVAKQNTVYDNEATQSALDSQHDKAVKAYDDPNIVEPAIAARTAIIEAHAERNGLPKEFASEQIAKATSQTRFDVLQQFVDNHQDLAASAYLAKYRDQFVGKNLTQAETLVNRGSIEGEGIRNADVITGLKPAPAGSVVQPATHEDDALKEAAKIQEPLVREKTEQRISQFFTRKTAAIRQQEQQAFESGYQTLRAHGGDLSAVPMSVRTAMGAMHDENLMSESKRIQTASDPGDPEQFVSMMNEAYFNPEQFAQESVPDLKGLNTAQKTRLMTLQRTIGGRQDRQDEAGLQHDVTRAQADSHYYGRKLETAKAGGDKTEIAHFEQLQTGADLDAMRAQDALTARRQMHHTASDAPPSSTSLNDDIAAAVAASAGHSAPATAVPSAPNAPAAPMTKPTPQMLQDVMRKGPRYAEYLRSHGIDVPLIVAPPKTPAKP